MADKKQKLTLILLPGDATAEELAEMFHALTGRRATLEEIEEARQILADADEELEQKDPVP